MRDLSEVVVSLILTVLITGLTLHLVYGSLSDAMAHAFESIASFHL